MEWKDKELGGLIKSALGRTVDSNSLIQIKDICEDSRRVQPGSLFVAVPGVKADGAEYVADAIARGASAIVIGESVSVDSRVPVIRVPDPRSAVAKLAAMFYGLYEIQRRGELKVVGITGTNGKSTIGFMVRHLLTRAGRKAALFGTIEYDLVSRKLPSDLTTPDAVTLTKHLIEAHQAGARHAVMEVSSHSLDQRRVDGINFAVGIFTNLTQDHLDYHGTIDEYLKAKRRLFDNLSDDAVAVVNVNDPAVDRILENCRARVIRFGLGHDAQARGTILNEDRTGGRFLLEFEGKHAEMRTPMVGHHNILNALAAAATGLQLGVDLPTIQQALSELSHVPGRLQRLDTGELGFDVFVDYAHTDDALKNVLASVRPLASGRLWCVFGCGGDRDRTKRPRMARAVAQTADRFVITSDNPRTEDPMAILMDIERGLLAKQLSRGDTIPDRAKAIRHVVERLEPGDSLVIAGKGHENYQIVGSTKHHFDDVEIAAEAIAARQGLIACAR